MFDQDCARVILLLLDHHFFSSSKQAKPVRMEALYNAVELSVYTQADIQRASQFLVDHDFVQIAAKDPKFISYINPGKYRFLCVTGKGRDYARLLEDNSGWKKCRKTLGNVFASSLKDIAAAVGASVISGKL